MSIDTSRFENSIRYEVVLEDGHTVEYWSTSTSAANLSLDTTHVTGKSSLSFDKIAGATSATIYRNPSEIGVLDLSMFALTGRFYVWVYFTSIADISSVTLSLGTDSANCFNWSKSVSDLQDGWNELQFKCTDFSQSGNGLNWYNIQYVALSVGFSSSSDTLTGIVLDSITIQDPLHNYAVGGDVNVGNSPYNHRLYQVLADVTNGVDNTYYYYIDLDTYKYLSLQFILDGGSGTVTCTVEISAADDVASPSSAIYEDMTSSFFCVNNFTQSTYAIVDTPLPARYGRVKVVASTGGADDADWKIYLVKTY